MQENMMEILFTPEGRLLVTLLLHGPATAEELSEKINRSMTRVYTYLKLLRSYGLVEKTGTLYEVTDRGRRMLLSLCRSIEEASKKNET